MKKILLLEDLKEFDRLNEKLKALPFRLNTYIKTLKENATPISKYLIS